MLVSVRKKCRNLKKALWTFWNGDRH